VTSLSLVAGFLAGLVLGALFFGGLRWTVARVPHARSPGLLVALSLALRLAAVASGLVALLRLWGWVAGVAALFGMLVARTVLVRSASGTGALPWS
jgi:F1F0 ATPase subunit 2